MPAGSDDTVTASSPTGPADETAELRQRVADQRREIAELRAALARIEAAPSQTLERAEADLRHSEERFRAIAESTPHPVVIASRSSDRIVYANASLERHFGLLGDARDHTLSELFDKVEDLQNTRTRLAARGGVRIGQVLPMRRHDGQRFWGVTSSVWLEFEGEAAILMSIVDITDRMQAESALQEQGTLFQAILEHVPDSIVFTDSDHVVRMLNSSAVNAFGNDAESILNQPISNLFVDAEPSRSPHPSGLGQERDERWMRGRDGEFRGEVYSTAVHDSTRQLVGYLNIIRDVTELRAAEEERRKLANQLQQAQKMQAIGELTGGIAHDFNNILASVLGYTQLALQFCVQDNTSNLARYLGEVRNAGERARDLVAQMLTFSRSEAADAEPLDPIPLAHEAMNLMRSTIPASVTINLRTDPHLPNVRLDPVHLHQMLMNLCINARDAMHGRGQIEMHLYAATVDAHCTSCNKAFRGDMVVVEVNDTGSGIEQDTLTRIFEPFFTTKRVGEGSGMGLAMVHGIVHSHQGHIVAESSARTGTSMKLMFPALTPQTLSPPVSAPAPVPADSDRPWPDGEGRILVVDDERAITSFLAELLERCGFEVRAFTASDEALLALEQSPDWPDLLITDQTMPGASGSDLVRQARQLNPALSVVLCTGHSEAVSEAEVLSWGNSAYLSKPIERGNLLDAIRVLKPDGLSIRP